MNNHVVIMAGGIGSRFWPMSTPECPKQFIDILGCGKTLLQYIYELFGTFRCTHRPEADSIKFGIPSNPKRQAPT